MRKAPFYPIVLLLLTVIFSCNNNLTQNTKPAADSSIATAAFDLAAVKAAIAASNKTFGEAFATNDSAAFVTHYTADACINPSNMPRMCGREAIGNFFKSALQMGIRNIQLTTEEVMGGKDAVAEIGKYDLLDVTGKSLDKGKFIVIWKEENGAWKMHRDEWNSDIPLPAPKK